MLILRIFIAVIFLVLFIYLMIDNRIERQMFNEVLTIAGKAITKSEELTNDLQMVLERCKEAERENATLHSIIRLNDCDNYLQKQEEDGNI